MRLLHNARIYTLDKNSPMASSIVIDHRRVIAIGNEEILREFDGRAKKEDMGGKVILPGLVDAHVHLKYYSLGLQKIDCETNTKEECLQRVKERAQKTKPGEWVLGHGWNQNVWGSWPTAQELDTVAPNHPVYLTAKSLHAGWANNAGLKAADITNSTPDPKDGKIQRNAKGNATGVLLESAMQLVSEKIPDATIDEIADAIEKAHPILWKMGLTGVHDFDRRDCFMALQVLNNEGRLKLRITKNIPVELVNQANEVGLRTGFGDDFLRIGSVKAFMDGALGPHTAAMFQPYEDEPDNFGILNMDGEELFEYARKAADVGLGMTVHAIGDKANHEVLNAYEQLRAYEKQNHLPRLRHRIEHVQVIHPDDAPRLGQLDIVASMQPIHATSDMLMADKYWGKERSRLAYAWREQLNHGAHLAFGSDAPVESPNPFWGLHTAVTRRRTDGTPNEQGWNPEQKLSVQEAIEGFTLGSAYAAYAENRMGQLKENYLADLIVLKKDPFTCDPSEIADMHSSATMVNGEWVWQE